MHTGLIRKIKKTYELPVWVWFLGCLVLAILMETLMEILGRRSVFSAGLFILHSPLVYIYNILIVYLTLLFSLLFPKRAFTLGLVTLLWLTCSVINCVVLGYRITPFSAIDLLMVTDVFSMLDIYLNKVQQVLLFSGILLFIVILTFAFIKTPNVKKNKHFVVNLITMLIVFAAVYLMTVFGIRNDLISDQFANLGTAYKDYGFAYCFSNSIIDVGISKPEGYSEETIDQMVSQFTEVKNAKTSGGPDIIIIQMESFIDIDRVKGVHTDQDPIAYFNAYQKIYPSGYFTVPAIGAGTANTEFELLTGMKSKVFGAGEYPYKTVLTDTPCESMAQLFRRYGYETHALHNNKARFYSRDETYASLGFETFTSVEYMQNVNYTETGWAKDDCLVSEIMNTLKLEDGTDSQQGSGKPQFIFAVSVQGHGRYPTDSLRCEEHIKVTLDSGDPELTNQFGYYVNQTYEMDQMIHDLKGELDKRKKPYLLVLYGDHIPSLTFEEGQFLAGDEFQTEYVMINNFGMGAHDENMYIYEFSDYLFSLLRYQKGIAQNIHSTFFQEQGLIDEKRENLKQEYIDSNEKDASSNLLWQEMYIEEPAKKEETEFDRMITMAEYDILYGEHYLYQYFDSYENVDMKLGISDIIISEITLEDGKLLVKGENFTPFSCIIIDGKRLDTEYIDDTMVRTVTEMTEDNLKEDVSVAVAQIDKDQHELSRTEEFIFSY